MNKQKGVIAQVYLYAIAGAVAFAIGAGVGFKIQQGKIDKLNVELGGYKTSVDSLTAAVKTQNAKIDELTVAANVRAVAAKAAIEAAKATGKAKLEAAQAILMQKPKTADACTEASQAFSDELKAERSAK